MGPILDLKNLNKEGYLMACGGSKKKKKKGK